LQLLWSVPYFVAYSRLVSCTSLGHLLTNGAWWASPCCSCNGTVASTACTWWYRTVPLASWWASPRLASPRLASSRVESTYRYSTPCERVRTVVRAWRKHRTVPRCIHFLCGPLVLVAGPRLAGGCRTARRGLPAHGAHHCDARERDGTGRNGTSWRAHDEGSGERFREWIEPGRFNNRARTVDGDGAHRIASHRIAS